MIFVRRPGDSASMTYKWWSSLHGDEDANYEVVGRWQRTMREGAWKGRAFGVVD